MFTEKEHQKQLERERKEQRKVERGELRSEQEQHEDGDPVIEKKDIVQPPVEPQQQQQSQQQQQQQQQQSAAAAMHNEGIIRAAHSMTHDVSHSEPVSLITVLIKKKLLLYFKIIFY